MKLLTYIKDINIYLLILDILLLVISFLFFNEKKCSQKIKDLFVIFYTLINIYLFNKLNTFFNSIFNFSNLSVKIYLDSILIAYIIFLFTINRKQLKKNLRAINYLLFFITNIILIINIYIILSIKIDVLPLINIDNPKVLNNINVIILIWYFMISSIIYIINNVISYRKKKRIELEIDDSKFLVDTKEIYELEIENGNKDEGLSRVLTVEELLNFDKNNALYINGVDCSIIFNDSNQDNIIKNYHILINNIEAKMVNGYTLNENIMLKNICQKLNTNNLFDINLDNFNILNKISIEEYNLLKKIK